jgi:hypothetical protein
MNDKLVFWAKSHARPICAVTVVVGSLVASQCFLSAGPLRSAAFALLEDPLSILSGRSPGARSGGALAQSKHAYQHARMRDHGKPGELPSERVLANVRSRPAAPVPETDVGLLPALPSSNAVSFGETLPGIPFSAPVSRSGIAAAGFPSGASGAVAGGAGGAGGGGGNMGAVPVVASAIPEPNSWALMLTGYFVVGTAYRRRRKAQSVKRPSDDRKAA